MSRIATLAGSTRLNERTSRRGRLPVPVALSWLTPPCRSHPGSSRLLGRGRAELSKEWSSFWGQGQLEERQRGRLTGWSRAGIRRGLATRLARSCRASAPLAPLVFLTALTSEAVTDAAASRCAFDVVGYAKPQRGQWGRTGRCLVHRAGVLCRGRRPFVRLQSRLTGQARP